MKLLSGAGLAALLLVTCASAATTAPLEVSEDGVVTRDGKPFRGVGVNYYDAFVRTLVQADDTSYLAGFDTLRAHGIPFARISIAAFWAKGQRQFLDDQGEYLRRLDGVVRAAEDAGVGLVPSFFWAYWTVPDLVGEPMRAWGSPVSKTQAFLREFTRTIVTRYKDSPAIWMWEFGNEFNLAADLPEVAEVLPPLAPGEGTPETREISRDLLTTEDVLSALKAFADTVRSIDPERPITSGHAIPRPRAESLRATRGWATLDSREISLEGLKLQHPPGIDVVSVHVYPEAINEVRFADGHLSSYAELFALYQGTGKPLFVGEFGAFTGQVPALDTEEKTLAEFRALLDAIVKSDVPLAAAWNFGGAESTGIKQQPWHFDGTLRKEYLDAVSETNRLLVGSGAPKP